MPATPKRKNVWTLLAPSSSFEAHFKSHPEHTKYIIEFQSDVTVDPFHHPTPKKIRLIQREVDSYPNGCYRWRKSSLRIVYLPEKEDHTIYPLDASTASSAKYKKRR